MKKVSIVIPAYNAERTIGRTLEACLAQSLPCEIVVADDGSTDSTPAVIAKFPVKYLRQENRGAAAARNLGWRAASGELVLFTDSDCVPDKDWALTLTRLLEEEGVGAAGGTYTLANPESLVASCIHYEIQYRHASLPREVRYLGSFSLGLPKALLEKLGGFDESFRIACGEDADLTYRVAASGLRLLFTREARTGHVFPTGTVNFLRQQFWRGYWIMKLVAKHPGRLGNDDYSKKRDAVQPPLFALSAALLPVCALYGFMPHWLLLNLAAFLLNVPPALFAVRASGRLRLLYLLPLLYLRGFFWAAGCAAGTLKFVVKL